MSGSFHLFDALAAGTQHRAAELQRTVMRVAGVDVDDAELEDAPPDGATCNQDLMTFLAGKVAPGAH